jgi:alpha-N-arabinofuranosidase
MLLQTIFYPLEMYGKRRSGISLQAAVSGPGYEGKTNGPVAYIDTSAILNGSQLNLFTTNRSVDETATVHLNLADRAIVALDSAEILTGPDPKALNTYEQPNLIQAQPFQSVEITAGQATVTLPPLSVTAMTFKLKE